MRIKELGVDFDLNPDGTMCKTLEAGHSRHRIVHHKDSTGKAIVDGLIDVVRTLPNVTICDNALVYSIDKALHGFYISILKDGKSYHYGCSYCLYNGRNRQSLQIQLIPQLQRVRNAFVLLGKKVIFSCAVPPPAFAR